ncbi:helix-turn-helix domain-containing protein [Thaumasiovibrio sp. DFM-14]|uniref:helix-turn-helix domain-containing protein n=1 Tax=Thaumasiovibrio sp. DFM-14 TaxID=3384792 RepID=UPI0039A134B4
MKFNNAENYSAPACARGFWLLQCLSTADEPLSLEQLYQLSGIPKATISRLLETLSQLEIIYRHSDKRYESLLQLNPVNGTGASFEERIRVEMTALSKQRGYAVEWYELSAKGLVLQATVSPILERKVWAKEGFIRNWQGEIDAVYRVGCAFADGDVIDNETAWYYGDHGNRIIADWKVELEKINSLNVSNGFADIHFNENGVRRSAVAVHDKSLFKGVLAIAECWTPSINLSENNQLQYLQNIRMKFE